MHVSSLWGEYSEGSFGCAAREWIDLLADCGFTYWQTLPFCLPDEANSPYKSYSAFSGNPFFIDLPLLCDVGLITRAELDEARQKTPFYCEFDRLNEERMALLSKASKRITNYAPVEDFMKSHPGVERFCRFMALKKANGGKEWTEWTVDIPDEDELQTWYFSQFVFFTQWAEIKAYANKKGIKIIGDIPIYVAHDSADVWGSPEQFLLEEDGSPSAVAGVPPDYFAKDGQLWGNPLYDWDYMKKDGYSMGDLMYQMLGFFADGTDEEEDIELEAGKMYILSNKSKRHGAACLLYEDFLKEKFGNRTAFIIPSSIHETLFIPVIEGMTSDELNAMICQVNEAEVRACERLSNHCYLWDGSEQKVKMAA